MLRRHQFRADVHFQMRALWHIEPLVLTFNRSLLAVLRFYAFLNAIKGMLEGGHELEFG
ncbi:hypothetical protein [Paraburkholderia sp. RAU2J]|uniref:hypothetical protein n=1 Tax=Paraburkholderia sp. RAU2J TaxID=1938810 RepID=UPI001F543FDD|nr:hypothetical protein [Paraburkholderia sp. RAU2J]